MIFKDFTLWTAPLQIKLLDVIPQIDLKLSSTRRSRYSEGRLQTSPTAKNEGCRHVLCLWLTPMAPSRSWPCSSLDSHFWSRQGPSTQLLDWKFLGLSRNIDKYGELQWLFRRPHINVMRDKKTCKSALPNSTSTVQQHCSFTNNRHQVSAEARNYKMKESITTTNLTLGWIGLTPNIARC
jgi:hypothetical protein